jgi:general secretion pathway protein I
MNDRGVTLLEAMIAMAIIAIAVPGLLALRNWDVELTNRAQTMTTATILAQAKLLETELIRFVPIGEQHGDFRSTLPGMVRTEPDQDRARGFRWTRIVAPTPFDAIREIRIRISWLDQGAEDGVEVTSYVLQSGAR